jgi:hypothetical protein
MQKHGSNKALFLQTEGRAVPCFRAAWGEHRAQKIQHTHTGRKRKGKKPSLNIMLAGLLELLPQCVFGYRQGLPYYLGPVTRPLKTIHIFKIDLLNYVFEIHCIHCRVMCHVSKE